MCQMKCANTEMSALVQVSKLRVRSLVLYAISTFSYNFCVVFEFSTCEGENKINSMVFFDGSIIAPTLTSKDCTDATDCGGVGFNVGMQISAMSLRTGQRIPDRKCSDPFHCEAFYSSPHQDTATTAVDAPAIITITFCPDETGGSPPVPAGAPGKPCII